MFLGILAPKKETRSGRSHSQRIYIREQVCMHAGTWIVFSCSYMCVSYNVIVRKMLPEYSMREFRGWLLQHLRC